MHITQWIIAHLFEIIGFLMALVLIPRILLERRYPGATVAWILAIGLVPYIGVPLYFIIGGRTIRRVRRKKQWSMVKLAEALSCRGEPALSPDCAKVSTLLTQSGAFPITTDNRVSVLDDGVKSYESLVSMIEKAEHSINIATFILGRDKVGEALVGLLARKAKEGVEVRLLLDALGSLRTRGKFVQPIRETGGQVGVFLPILPLRRKWSANLRNHRKMAIVDGKEAIVGGMNLAMEYMGPDPYARRWKDVSMHISGGGVRDLLTIFRQDWTFTTGEEFADVLDKSGADEEGEGCSCSVVQVVGEGPDLSERPLYTGVLAALSKASQSIWIVTPYFVPDEPLSAALMLASRLGVDVRLIMPEHSNHPLIDLAGRSFLPELMDAGVSIYAYRPGMLHAKLIAIDGHMAVVGSANMDVRSFNLNFEVAAFLYNTADVRSVLDVMDSVMARSNLLSREKLESEGRTMRFAEDVCRVFSPLL